ncbi:MAG TPA: ferredoxin [Candidatus Wirthbacteria bacterium]|nr:ferredoxin [Candidatus Wirthbacteria bacterium]
MSILREEDLRHSAVEEVARQMLIAARTAPKGKGRDTLRMALVTREESGVTINQLASKMQEMAESEQAPKFFLRDAENLAQSSCIVLIGTVIKPLGLPQCGLCGFADCAAKQAQPLSPCAFNTIDLGIAVGSAASIAADARIDNRIMYSIGRAAAELKLLGEEPMVIMGIPLSISSKNPFFDRN